MRYGIYFFLLAAGFLGGSYLYHWLSGTTPQGSDFISRGEFLLFCASITVAWGITKLLGDKIDGSYNSLKSKMEDLEEKIEEMRRDLDSKD